jgi:hypothetical protein
MCLFMNALQEHKPNTNHNYTCIYTEDCYLVMYICYQQGCEVGVTVVELEPEGILGGVGVSKNVPIRTPTSI